MISFLNKHKTSILVITLAFFIGSIAYIGLGSYSRGNFGLNAAQVGSTAISRRTLDRQYSQFINQLRNNGGDLTEQEAKQLQQRILATLISDEILAQAAQNAGMVVSDYEIAYDIKTNPYLQDEGKFSPAAYAQLRRALGNVSSAEFEEQLRHDKLANRFRHVLYSLYKMTPQEIKNAYQVQNGNLNDFEENKKFFASAIMDTKMESAPNAFFDDFNRTTRVQTFLE